MNDRGIQCRLVLCGLLLFLAMAGVAVHLAYLHLGPHDPLRVTIDRNRHTEDTVPGPRGGIFDRHGRKNVLALDVSRDNVCADPKTISLTGAVDETALTLSSALKLTVDEVQGQLSRTNRRYAVIKPYADDEEVNDIKAKKMKGVFFREARIRYYPHQELMCHVLGFVNHQGVGSAGIELSRDRELRGTPGKVQSRVDALGNRLYWDEGICTPPISGANVFLTIDQNVQYIVEKALDEAMAEHHAKGAWAVIQRVKTGEILALANRPAYNLNEFRTAESNAMMNRAIGFIYEPGSTFKAIAFSAALNEGLVTENTVFDCENGAWEYKRRVLHDYHPYGRLTVADGLKKSSNIMTAKIALQLGEQRYYQYLKAFHIGEKTGIDLQGEEMGMLAPVSKWYGISITRIPMGQGVAVTGLQLLNVYAAIANDGYMMRPYVISKIVAPDGTILHERKPEVIGQPLRTETAQLMKRLLSRVTDEGGTGTRAQVDGYEVAGKTGSAQKPLPHGRGYSATDYVASFVGFLPAEDPEIALVIVVDVPQPLHTGGVVAGPIFSRIAGQAVRCLDIPPARPLGLARNE